MTDETKTTFDMAAECGATFASKVLGDGVDKVSFSPSALHTFAAAIIADDRALYPPATVQVAGDAAIQVVGAMREPGEDPGPAIPRYSGKVIAGMYDTALVRLEDAQAAMAEKDNEIARLTAERDHAQKLAAERLDKMQVDRRQAMAARDEAARTSAALALERSDDVRVLMAERDAALKSEAVYRQLCDDAKPFAESNIALRAERDGLKQDAARYRWLRSDDYEVLPGWRQIYVIMERLPNTEDADVTLTESALDDAIDLSIAAMKESGK